MKKEEPKETKEEEKRDQERMEEAKRTEKEKMEEEKRAEKEKMEEAKRVEEEKKQEAKRVVEEEKKDDKVSLDLTRETANGTAYEVPETGPSCVNPYSALVVAMSQIGSSENSMTGSGIFDFGTPNRSPTRDTDGWTFVETLGKPSTATSVESELGVRPKTTLQNSSNKPESTLHSGTIMIGSQFQTN